MFVHSDGRVFKVVGEVVDESLVLDISNGVFTGPWLAWLARCWSRRFGRRSWFWRRWLIVGRRRWIVVGQHWFIWWVAARHLHWWRSRRWRWGHLMSLVDNGRRSWWSDGLASRWFSLTERSGRQSQLDWWSVGKQRLARPLASWGCRLSPAFGPPLYGNCFILSLPSIITCRLVTQQEGSARVACRWSRSPWERGLKLLAALASQ